MTTDESGMGLSSAEDARELQDRSGSSAPSSDSALGLDVMGAALAHELNQPLTALTLYLQSIQRACSALAGGEAIAIPTEKALREAERVTQIVKRMRRYTTRVEPDRVSASLNALIRETLESIETQVPGSLTLELGLAEDLPMVAVDAVQIRQVLVNLLRNAMDAVAETKVPLIRIETRKTGDSVEVLISDNGSGVPLAFQQRLFKAFETTKSQGLGLGLAISRMIAQNHGGDLGLVPRGIEEGASFCLRLPAQAIQPGGT